MESAKRGGAWTPEPRRLGLRASGLDGIQPVVVPPLGAEAVDALAEVLLEPLGVGEAAEELVTGADAVRLEGKQVVGIGCRALGQAPEDRRHWATCRAEMAAAGVQALSRSAGADARCTRTQLSLNAKGQGPRRGAAHWTRSPRPAGERVVTPPRGGPPPPRSVRPHRDSPRARSGASLAQRWLGSAESRESCYG